MNRLRRERSSGKSHGQRRSEQFDRLRGKMLAKDRALVDLRKELDPEQVPAIVQRIFALADRAVRANKRAALAPGLEALARLASDLARRSVPTETIERHREAHRILAQIGGQDAASAALVGALEAAVIDAAELPHDVGPGSLQKRLALIVPGRAAAGEAVAEVLETYRKGRGRQAAMLRLLVSLGLKASTAEPGDMKKPVQRGRALLAARARALVEAANKGSDRE